MSEAKTAKSVRTEMWFSEVLKHKGQDLFLGS